MSPVYSGGLQPGDIVTHIDGQAINAADDVYRILAGSKAKTMHLSVNRSGRSIELSVTPEDLS